MLSLFYLIVGPPSDAASLSWKEAVETAKLNNSKLLQQKEKLIASEARRRALRAPYYPKLSAAVDGSQSSTDSSGATTNSQSYSTSLSLQHNLYRGGADRAADREAEIKLNLAELETQGLKASLSYELKGAFLRRLFAQRRLRLAEEVLARRQDNRDLVSLQFEAGKENKGSYLLASAAVDKAKWDRASIEVELANYLEQLCIQLGQTECAYESVSEKIADLESPIVSSPDFARLAKESLDYRTKDLAWETSRVKLAAAEAAFFPQLDWSTSYSQSGSGWLSGDTTWRTGLSLRIPIFAGGSDYYEVAARKSEVVSAQLERDYIFTEKTSNLRAKFAALKLARDKAQVDLAYVEAARLRAKIARGKYHNGLVSFEDWDRIEGELITREQNMHESEMNRLLAESDWQLALGEGALQ